MTVLEKKIYNHIDLFFTKHQKKRHSLCVQVFKKGKKISHLKWGENYKYYDLSSLTKILFTTSLFMKAQSVKKIKTSHFVRNFLDTSSSIKIKDLLSHSAGLKAYFKDLSFLEVHKKKERKDVLKTLLLKQLNKSAKGIKKPCYSDLSFLLLGFILEEMYQKSLFDIWEEERVFFKYSSLRFNKDNNPYYSKNLYAPTYRDHYKKKGVQGEVNDGLCSLLSGVSSHAGLFGSDKDLAHWFLHFHKSFKGLKSSLISPAVFKNFSSALNDQFCMGFMRPTSHSSSGLYFSTHSIGHLGYSGPSFWWDLKKDICVVILINRLKEEALFLKKLRPYVHNVIMRELL